MSTSSTPRLSIYVAGVIVLALAAFAARTFVSHRRPQPESLTMAPDGTLIVGSASTPFIYKVHPGTSTAEKFIDASTEGRGTFFFGVLADAPSMTLWACQLTPVPDTTPARLHSALRGFDLSSGAPKLRWSLPGDSNMCNDLAIGPDKALYITDTVNGRIFRMQPAGSSPELLLEHHDLVGVDGITLLDGMLYVNNVFTSYLYRIPVDVAGHAGQPVDIALDHPINRPDGMRAANGKLFVAESGSGRISSITVNGDKATVAVLKEGLKTPTAVEPAGDTIWITERGAGRTVSIPMPR
jgi:streptogramin lyase